MKQIRKRLTYANVMSSIAVFLVLGGAAVAATQLPKNSVGTKQLKKNSVTGAKVKNRSIGAADLKQGAIPPQVDAYTKAESNAQFAAKAETYTKAETYSRAESDSRFLGKTVVVVKTLANSIPANNFQTGTVDCPAGYVAIGGGVDPNGVFYGKVSSSGPMIGGQRLNDVADGQAGPATGWYAAVTTEGAGTGTAEVKLAVICAPIG